jgi:hypothetical protein
MRTGLSGYGAATADSETVRTASSERSLFYDVVPGSKEWLSKGHRAIAMAATAASSCAVAADRWARRDCVHAGQRRPPLFAGQASGSPRRSVGRLSPGGRRPCIRGLDTSAKAFASKGKASMPSTRRCVRPRGRESRRLILRRPRSVRPRRRDGRCGRGRPRAAGASAISVAVE